MNDHFAMLESTISRMQEELSANTKKINGIDSCLQDTVKRMSKISDMARYAINNNKNNVNAITKRLERFQNDRLDDSQIKMMLEKLNELEAKQTTDIPNQVKEKIESLNEEAEEAMEALETLRNSHINNKNVVTDMNEILE